MNNLQGFELIADIIRSFILIYFFKKVLPYKKYNKVFALIILAFYTFISTNKISDITNGLNENQIFIFISLCYLIVLVYPFILKNGRSSEKFFLSSLYMSIALLSSFISNIVFSKIFNISYLDIVFISSYERVIALFIGKAIQFIIISIIINHVYFIKHLNCKTLYISGIILYLNHALVCIMERYIFINIQNTSVYMVIIIITLCIIQKLDIYILSMLSKDLNKEFLLKLNLDKKDHEKEIINIYNEINGWRHDYKNHISIVLGLLEIGANKEAIDYLREIDNNISKLDKVMYTDNVVINSILTTKINLAKDNNIDTNISVNINENIKISNVDICTVLSNLLDNSIEACSKIKGYRFMSIKITTKDNNLIIKITNNTNGKEHKVNGKFLTTKKGKASGLGLFQIDNIIKKHKGYINRKHENNMFLTYIRI